MKIDLLKYKILLDNKSESITNKISNYKNYGFNNSDLVEILFVLTNDIIIENYNTFFSNLNYEIISILQ